jgi:phage I-like protein
MPNLIALSAPGRRLAVPALVAKLAATAAARSVRLDAEGKEPPKEFRIFAFGEVETSKGTFLFDQAAAQLVLAAYADQGNELCCDYEHGMAEAAEAMPRPAACWFSLELRDDGLYATGCKWTPRAAKLLADGEYRYFSPWMEFDAETGRILRLLNLALTNIPATKSMQPLVAASARPAARDLRTPKAQLSSLALTFEQIRDALDRALRALLPNSYPWLCDVYDDSCVFESGGRLYQLAYAIPEGTTVTVRRGGGRSPPHLHPGLFRRCHPHLH